MDKVEYVYRAVLSEELRIDAEGRVWRTETGDRAERSYKFNGPDKPASLVVQARNVTTPAARLVWRHFHGPIPDGGQVRFRDGDNTNLRPDNLTIRVPGERNLDPVDPERMCAKGLHSRTAENGRMVSELRTLADGRRIRRDKWHCYRCLNVYWAAWRERRRTRRAQSD